MSLAELSITQSSATAQAKGYSGRNMTLPASWWTSTSLFQLERRAIFSKVFLPLTLVTIDMALRNSRFAFR